MENLLPISVTILRVRCLTICKDLPVYSRSVSEKQEIILTLTLVGDAAKHGKLCRRTFDSLTW